MLKGLDLFRDKRDYITRSRRLKLCAIETGVALILPRFLRESNTRSGLSQESAKKYRHEENRGAANAG
jgi:hypothetical protein